MVETHSLVLERREKMQRGGVGIRRRSVARRFFNATKSFPGKNIATRFLVGVWVT